MSESVNWRIIEGIPQPFVGDKQIIISPQPGGQSAFVSSPIEETLFAGNRGGGKSLCLLLDFIQHVGQGFGADWKGIVFRQTYPQLKEIVDMSRKWFPLIWPQSQFNEAKLQWKFPAGEQLMFRHMHDESDYYSYHGWSVPWLGFEELTTWPTDKCYKLLFSIVRSTNPKMPRKIRSTTNPAGSGHSWVKRRFKLPIPSGKIIGPIIEEKDDNGKPLPLRVCIKSDLKENKVLMVTDPDYVGRIISSATSAAQLAAWVDGSWDIVSGGMFDDIWEPRIHVVPNINANQIPVGWRLDKSYDHGQSKPFSVGWWAQSNGEAIVIQGRKIGAVPGDLIRIYEWYGCHSNAVNEGLRLTSREIARGIIEREKDYRLYGHVKLGVADSAIFDDYEPGSSCAGDMKKLGVYWYPADKGPGSRSQGWQQFRMYLQGALPTPKGIRETPGLFVCERCVDFTRTIPVLPRDPRKPDDVDTDAEDHIGDEVRYRLRKKNMEAKSGSWK